MHRGTTESKRGAAHFCPFLNKNIQKEKGLLFFFKSIKEREYKIQKMQMSIV